MEEIFGHVPTRGAPVFALNSDSETQFCHFSANAKAQGGGNRPIPCAFSDLRAVFPLSRLLPRAVIERVGYLDETLFMYCEDVDYCLRLTRAGVPLWFLPDAVIHHKAGGSAGGMLSVYYITRNTLNLTCKGRSTAYARLKTILPLLTGAARYALTKTLGRKKGRSYGAFRGAVDFWNGKMGRMEG